MKTMHITKSRVDIIRAITFFRYLYPEALKIVKIFNPFQIKLVLFMNGEDG